MAKLVTVGGGEMEVLPASDAGFTLTEVQKAVGGYVELLHVGDGYALVDEEGLIKKKPVNEKASYMLGRIIVGDVLFVTKKEFK